MRFNEEINFVEEYSEYLESFEKGDSIYCQSFIPFKNLSYKKEKEKSQRGDLMNGQDMPEISEGYQNNENSNIFNYSENLNEKSLNQVLLDKVKDENDRNRTYYERINYISNILNESTIILRINNLKKNKIKFEKLIYIKGEITYEEFITPSREEQKYLFELDKCLILFKNNEKLNEYLNVIKEIANKYFSEIILKNELLIKIKIKESSNKNTDENIKFINSEYSIDNFCFNQNYQDENILKDGDYKGYKGFESFLKEIIKYINNSSTNFATNDNEQINKYSFISFKKIIGKHKGIAQKIMELKDGHIISSGDDGIIQYKKDFTIDKENHFDNNFYSFFIVKDKDKDEDEVIISLKNEFIFSSRNTSISNIDALKSCRNLFTLKKNDCLISKDDGIYYISDIFKPVLINRTPSNLYKKTYLGGIKINDDIIALTSNSILSNGENKLIFFNSKAQKFLEEIEINNYSFTLSENNCSIMKIPNHENSILLLAACKKYKKYKKNNKGDKNGILLIKLQFFNFEIKKSQNFYETENFEVFCFCPLLEIKNKDIFKNDQIIESEYFLVGGFDIYKREGLIKLYKVIYYDENEKIELIQDIIIEKKKRKNDQESFTGFKGPISCIIQSPEKGVLVTCYDGNVYLFSQPHFEKIREIENKSILYL